MNKHWKLSVGAAVLVMSFGVQADTIDLFTQNQGMAKDTSNGDPANYANGNFTQSVNAPATIIGGYRDLWVNAVSGASFDDGGTAGDPSDDISIGSSLVVSGGQLRFSNDAGVIGIGEVQWDGNDGSSAIASAVGTGLNGYDLTQSGTLNAFELTTIESDLGYKFEVTIYSDTNKWSKINFDATAVVDDGTPVVSFIDFAGFFACGTYGAALGVNAITCGAGGPADLTKVTAIVARLNTGDFDNPAGPDEPSTTNIDLRLTSITTVPEPGVLALMGMGLIAAGFASRRRKSQA